MTLIDNSDLAWMIYADWMDEHNVPYAQELRESITQPQSCVWNYEYRGVVGGGGVGVGVVVGGVGVGGVGVGVLGVGGVGVGGGGVGVGGVGGY